MKNKRFSIISLIAVLMVSQANKTVAAQNPMGYQINYGMAYVQTAISLGCIALGCKVADLLYNRAPSVEEEIVHDILAASKLSAHESDINQRAFFCEIFKGIGQYHKIPYTIEQPLAPLMEQTIAHNIEELALAIGERPDNFEKSVGGTIFRRALRGIIQYESISYDQRRQQYDTLIKILRSTNFKVTEQARKILIAPFDQFEQRVKTENSLIAGGAGLLCSLAGFFAAVKIGLFNNF